MAKVQTAFSPVTNGFQFVNYFQYTFPVKYQLPFVGAVSLGDVVFGLCGGMCASALDYFYAKTPVPHYDRPDKIDQGLYTYLCERQLQSLSVPVLLKIIDWMMAEDDELATRMTRVELPKLRRSLESGVPAVLGLIRVKGVNNPTDNHQVLAVGYDLSPDGQSMVISLYDPNHPCEEPTITVGLTKTGFRISESTGEPLRGLFIIPYKAQVAVPKPPALQPVSFEVPAAGVFQLHWPVDSRICTQHFGEHPENYAGFGLPGHEGLDLLALENASVYAAADGDVFEAGPRPANHPYGIQIRVRHMVGGQEYHTIYAHLKQVLVGVGQHVSAGQKIGLADSTGNSTGAHLHLTLKRIGARTGNYPPDIIDPWPFLQNLATPPSQPPPSPSGIIVYTNAQVNLRAQPSTDADIITNLPVAEGLAVLGDAAVERAKIGQTGQWLQVRTASAQTGYVAAWLVSDARQEAFPPSGLIVYPVDTVNLRSGPGTAFDLLATFSFTDPLSVLGDAGIAQGKIGQTNQWLQVQAQNGQRGFIAAWLVHQTGQVPPAAGLTVYPTVMVNVRARPSTDGNIMVMAMPGDALKVLGEKSQALAAVGQQGQWLSVQTPAKLNGYVAAWLVQAALSAPPPQGTGLTVYPTDDVNLRAQPSANSPRLDGANRSEALAVIDADLNAARTRVGQQDQWIYVQKASGSRGWVAAWYLSLNPA